MMPFFEALPLLYKLIVTLRRLSKFILETKSYFVYQIDKQYNLVNDHQAYAIM
ncbi:hypothetical protein Syun_027575 [Stephania yunnanensis]|uniref:Uncharacterized protein n=1 Tax=Stephania yunnanensis TaxID=152371 RepID=A0AAP0EPQ0_9MAGN